MYPDDDDTVILPPRPHGAAGHNVVHSGTTDANSADANGADANGADANNADADTILRATPHRERKESDAAAPVAGTPAEQDSGSVSPAVLGFRLGDSPIVLLDTVVYLGRKPSPPRVTRGAAPRLVRVISATNEVSSTHVELRQLGSMVVVTDLKSTNGTRVLLPGHPVRSLRPGESITIGIGTLIDVGDGNVLELVRPGVSL